MPGTAGRVGLTRLLAWIPDFSSTDHTTALSGGFEVQPAHVRGLGPELGVMAGHPRLGLPRLEIRGRCRCATPATPRSATPCSLRRAGDRFHRPAGRRIRRRLGHRLDQQQHVVVVIDRRPAGALAVAESDQPELGVASPPHRHLVVVHPDRSPDLPIRTRRPPPSAPTGPARRRGLRRCWNAPDAPTPHGHQA